MKKTLIISGIISLLLSAQPVAAHHTYAFPDVPTNYPYFSSIEYLRLRNVLLGYRNGTYRPNERMSRAQLAAIVVRSKGLTPSTTQYKDCYSDVFSQWYANEVCYAKSLGWLSVFSGQFRPLQKVTAYEAYRIISAAYNFDVASGTQNYGTSISRGEIADLLYRTMIAVGATNTVYYVPPVQYQAPVYQPPVYYVPPAATTYYYPPQQSYVTSPYSVSVPAGYPRPWVP